MRPERLSQRRPRPTRYGARTKLLTGVPNLDTMGNRIRYHRIEKDMTQNDLAQAIDTTKSFVSLLEGSRTEASVDTIVRLSEVFEVSLDWLVAGNDSSRDINARLTNLAKEKSSIAEHFRLEQMKTEQAKARKQLKAEQAKTLSGELRKRKRT